MAWMSKGPLLPVAGKAYFKLNQGRTIHMTIRQKLQQFANYQRTTRALKQLDARQLADIGVQRENIAALARGTAL